jgi:hypothetical protein
MSSIQKSCLTSQKDGQTNPATRKAKQTELHLLAKLHAFAKEAFPLSPEQQALGTKCDALAFSPSCGFHSTNGNGSPVTPDLGHITHRQHCSEFYHHELLKAV